MYHYAKIGLSTIPLSGTVKGTQPALGNTEVLQNCLRSPFAFSAGLLSSVLVLCAVLADSVTDILHFVCIKPIF